MQTSTVVIWSAAIASSAVALLVLPSRYRWILPLLAASTLSFGLALWRPPVEYRALWVVLWAGPIVLPLYLMATSPRLQTMWSKWSVVLTFALTLAAVACWAGLGTYIGADQNKDDYYCDSRSAEPNAVLDGVPCQVKPLALVETFVTYFGIGSGLLFLVVGYPLVIIAFLALWIERSWRRWICIGNGSNGD